MKDFQQAMVLRQMTADLGWPIKIVIAPTVREADGLAMSFAQTPISMNSGDGRAVCLYYALRTARDMVKVGMRDTKEIEREMKAVIKAAGAEGED